MNQERGARRVARWVGAAAMTCAVVALVDARQAGGFNAHDDFTEYHLLDPASHQFHIVYYLNQRQVGATTLLNQTRSGSEGSDVSVSDPQTGRPLKFEYRTGAELNAAGETGRLTAEEHYIRAFLPRPVPQDGEGRVRIEKTYLDDKSYFTQGEEIVFARSLGIGRNAIVLPKGYGVTTSNVAAQLTVLPDGRIKFVFENVNTYAADVSIRAHRTTAAATSTLTVVERAFDFGKTLYDLGDPATHDVGVRHEYVETTAGSQATPSFLARHQLTGLVVTDMDMGKPLNAVQQRGAWTIQLATPIAGPSESAHISIMGKMQDASYRANGSELQWQRILHEPRTTILLPAGWDVTAASAPATVTAGRDGRVALQVYNPRVEPLMMAISAVRVVK